MTFLVRRAAAVAVAGVVALSSCAAGTDSIGVATSFNVLRVSPAEREPAPSFAGETLLDGSEVSDGIIQGAVGVLNFWGSWCGPCRREQAELEALWKEYEPRGVRFVGINTRRDQRAAALAYLEEFEVTYPSIYDPPSRIAADFRVRVMPATFVIDREGRVAAQIVGALRSEQDLRDLLEEELAR